MDLLEEESLNKVPLLIYANKQDLVSALSSSDLAKELNLPSIKNRAWQVRSNLGTNYNLENELIPFDS